MNTCHPKLCNMRTNHTYSSNILKLPKHFNFFGHNIHNVKNINRPYKLQSNVCTMQAKKIAPVKRTNNIAFLALFLSHLGYYPNTKHCILKCNYLMHKNQIPQIRIRQWKTGCIVFSTNPCLYVVLLHYTL